MSVNIEPQENDVDDTNMSQITIPDLPEVSHEEKMRRRATMADISTQFEEQRKKVERGIDIDYSMADLMQNLNQFDPNLATSGRDLTMDGIAVKQYSQLLLSKVAQFRDKKNAVLNIKLFARKIQTYSQNIDKNRGAMEVIGRKHGHLLKYAPNFDYMRPNFNVKVTKKPKPKKEPKKLEKNKAVDKAVVLKGKTTKEAQAETTEDNSLTKQLDNLRKSLKKVLKEAGTDRLNYYQFILDPTDFGKSVENMFYMSFLIKDGYVKFEVDPQSGLPDIVWMSSDARREFANNDRSKWQTSQCITKFTYQQWQKLVEYFEITKPLIERRE